MKTRQGFVSNSSSSSFLIMGKWIDEEIENADELEEKGILTFIEDESGPCVGVRFNIKDDETWGQYKQRVANILTESGILAKPSQIQICYGSYYN